mmetsp:Transcript_25684/g.78945  ORF Transcript_25684/g.78945 Transcript_25684/m.78945 type:complete len:308 (+) Transcript_25684:270-1193(+)
MPTSIRLAGHLRSAPPQATLLAADGEFGDAAHQRLRHKGVASDVEARVSCMVHHDCHGRGRSTAEANSHTATCADSPVVDGSPHCGHCRRDSRGRSRDRRDCARHGRDGGRGLRNRQGRGRARHARCGGCGAGDCRACNGHCPRATNHCAHSCRACNTHCPDRGYGHAAASRQDPGAQGPARRHGVSQPRDAPHVTLRLQDWPPVPDREEFARLGVLQEAGRWQGRAYIRLLQRLHVVHPPLGLRSTGRQPLLHPDAAVLAYAEASLRVHADADPQEQRLSLGIGLGHLQLELVRGLSELAQCALHQ